MLREPRRLISAGIAIVLGVAFVALTLLLGDGTRATVRAQAAGSVGAATAVVSVSDTRGATPLATDAPEEIRSLAGVSDVRPATSTVVLQQADGYQQALTVSTVPPLTDATVLSAGRLPEGPGEIVLTDRTARVRSVAVGDRIVLTPVEQAGAGDGKPTTVTVVGTIAPGPTSHDRTNAMAAYATDAQIFAWQETPGYVEIMVDGTGDPSALVTAVAALPDVRAGQATVRTGPDEVDHRLEEYLHGSGILQGVLVGFAVVALMVAALVITNTFAILVAQRTRTLALLRCVGATRGQVFRQVVGEGLLIGAVGSVAGLVLALGLAALAVRLSRGSGTEILPFTPSLTSLVVPLLLGVGITVVAALHPARAATSVAPLAALRPISATPTPGGPGLIRAIAAAGLVLLGAAGLVDGATRPSLALGLAGGVVSFAGVLLLAIWLVPGLARVLGMVPARLAGAPGALAVENARRNPRRAATTAGALLIGTTLVSLMLVGAASGSATMDRVLAREVPVDAVAAPAGTLSPDTYERMAATPGVAAAVRVHGADLTWTADTAHGKDAVTGLPPQARDVLHDPSVLAGLDDTTILLPADSGVPDGAPVTVAGPAEQVTLRAVVPRDGSVLAVSDTTLAELAPDAGEQVWFRYAADADSATVTQDLTRTAGSAARIASSDSQRDQMQSIVDTMLWVVLAMLAMAVVIAIIGIGNTLGLSVLERTQESGLLRALGLTRRQLRAMIGWEALMLAAVGTLLGVALGIAYGVAGIHALLAVAGGADITVAVAIPWARLAAVVVLALAAGWLAAIAPARRAARISPASALVTE